MNDQIAFIGDIHGEARVLDRALLRVEDIGVDRCVFLGDYVNRGKDSKGVIERLIRFQKKQKCTFLRGNHDELMIKALTGQENIGPFLKVGGAVTIHSYLLGMGAEPNVFEQFQALVPDNHKKFLASTVDSWGTASVYASHEGPADPHRLTVLGHEVVDEVTLGEKVIKIDTGCGLEGGKLSVLFYPSLKVKQFAVLP